MLLVDAALSAAVNLFIFAGLPFGLYFAYQRWRNKREVGEIAQRAGLQLGEGRYIGYSLAFTLVTVTILILWPLSLAAMVREGSAQRSFVGLGLNGPSILMALLYGVVKTGFPEELLFRGLIAGSLSRRLPLPWANLVQALIFLAPHLFVLLIAPELWGILLVIFAGALLMGWVRIKSGSIVGPWLMHASLNVAMSLIVAIRTAT